MAKTKLPDDVRDFFVKEGARGGKIGGKKRMDALTPEERSELARKAVAARKKRPAKKASAKMVARKKPKEEEK